MKGITIMILVMLLSFFIAGLYSSVPIVKTAIKAVLDPTAGNLLDWNKLVGMILIVFIITLITTLIQKYATDQVALKKLKEEQKLLQEEMKKYRDNPEKMLEFQKKQLEFLPKTFDLTSRSLIYTVVPIVLFFRWFYEYFASSSYKFFGFLNWFWFYLILSIIVSTILRKVMKVA